MYTAFFIQFIPHILLSHSSHIPSPLYPPSFMDLFLTHWVHLTLPVHDCRATGAWKTYLGAHSEENWHFLQPPSVANGSWTPLKQHSYFDGCCNDWVSDNVKKYPGYAYTFERKKLVLQSDLTWIWMTNMFLSFILFPTQISVLLVFWLYVCLGVLETLMNAHLNISRMK